MAKAERPKNGSASKKTQGGLGPRGKSVLSPKPQPAPDDGTPEDLSGRLAEAQTRLRATIAPPGDDYVDETESEPEREAEPAPAPEPASKPAISRLLGRLGSRR